jgi:hypothetical protein
MGKDQMKINPEHQGLDLTRILPLYTFAVPQQ